MRKSFAFTFITRASAVQDGNISYGGSFRPAGPAGPVSRDPGRSREVPGGPGRTREVLGGPGRFTREVLGRSKTKRLGNLNMWTNALLVVVFCIFRFSVFWLISLDFGCLRYTRNRACSCYTAPGISKARPRSVASFQTTLGPLHFRYQHSQFLAFRIFSFC